MEDQLIGGLIMWIPGGFIFVLIMTVVFFKWASRDVDAAPDWSPPRIAPHR